MHAIFQFASTMPSTVVFAARHTQKMRSSVVIPAILISVSVLVPLLCAIWRWSRSGRVTPAYVQEQPVEKPKLCEVALVDTGHGGYWSFKAPLPHPWCRLRVRAAAVDNSRVRHALTFSRPTLASVDTPASIRETLRPLPCIVLRRLSTI